MPIYNVGEDSIWATIDLVEMSSIINNKPHWNWFGFSYNTQLSVTRLICNKYNIVVYFRVHYLYERAF